MSFDLVIKTRGCFEWLCWGIEIRSDPFQNLKVFLHIYFEFYKYKFLFFIYVLRWLNLCIKIRLGINAEVKRSDAKFNLEINYFQKYICFKWLQKLKWKIIYKWYIWKKEFVKHKFNDIESNWAIVAKTYQEHFWILFKTLPKARMSKKS